MALTMFTMRFADEIVPKSKAGFLPSQSAKPAPKELRLAAEVIDSLSTTWGPGRYKDTYTDEVRKLTKRQAEGKHVVVEEQAAGQVEIFT
jgi:DNA end-binding protein Ku